MTEQAVQQALHTLGHGKTMIIVAHRLTTVQDADRILVLDSGRVVEQGTHQELIQRADGKYAELVMKLSQS